MCDGTLNLIWSWQWTESNFVPSRSSSLKLPSSMLGAKLITVVTSLRLSFILKRSMFFTYYILGCSARSFQQRIDPDSWIVLRHRHIPNPWIPKTYSYLHCKSTIPLDEKKSYIPFRCQPEMNWPFELMQLQSNSSTSEAPSKAKIRLPFSSFWCQTNHKSSSARR